MNDMSMLDKIIQEIGMLSEHDRQKVYGYRRHFASQ